jgi:hypothetical protein
VSYHSGVSDWGGSIVAQVWLNCGQNEAYLDTFARLTATFGTFWQLSQHFNRVVPLFVIATLNVGLPCGSIARHRMPW